MSDQFGLRLSFTEAQRYQRCLVSLYFKATLSTASAQLSPSKACLTFFIWIWPLVIVGLSRMMHSTSSFFGFSLAPKVNRSDHQGISLLLLHVSFSTYFLAVQLMWMGFVLQWRQAFLLVKSTLLGVLWILRNEHCGLPHSFKPRHICKVLLPLLHGWERSQFHLSLTFDSGSFSLYSTSYFMVAVVVGGAFVTCTASSLSMFSWLACIRLPFCVRMSYLEKTNWIVNSCMFHLAHE